MYRIEQKSYPIHVVRGYLRHHYYLCNETDNHLEVHPGMDRIVVAENTYGTGRTERIYNACEKCAAKMINRLEKHNRFFNIFLWNCDCIAGQAVQTILLWLAGISVAMSFFWWQCLLIAAVFIALVIIYNKTTIFHNMSVKFCPHVSPPAHDYVLANV